jgi:glycosyltransferase involved in cell wall biosynthesis
LYLEARGWEVTVYCQEEGENKTGIRIDHWRGVRRVNIPIRQRAAIGTIVFDWRAIRHAMKEPGVPLILGYNTAIFSLLLRLSGRSIVVNMDGIEWRRDKWSLPVKAWFWFNDWLASLTSTALVADHPEIAKHLATRRKWLEIVRFPCNISMIPYGGDLVQGSTIDALGSYGLEPNKYLVSVCRIEPENSLLLLVRAFSQRPRGIKFFCVGKFDPDTNDYHRQVRDAASPEVLFPGPIYDANALPPIREHALAYCHGHTIGGPILRSSKLLAQVAR